MTHQNIGPPAYLIVFAGLIALTGATIGLSYVDLGAWHGTVGLAIASSKATLVVLFFMHALYSPRLIWLVALAGIFWLGILLGLTLSDYSSRGWSVY